MDRLVCWLFISIKNEFKFASVSIGDKNCLYVR